MTTSAGSNHAPLTPQSFLRRNARVYPHKTAIIYGARKLTYREFFERSCRLANGLRGLGLGYGDTVAALIPNTPAHLEANFGVHMAGATLVSINNRLSAPEVAYIVGHAGCKAMLVDWEFLPLLRQAAGDLPTIRHCIVIREPGAEPPWQPAGALDYEAFLVAASAQDPQILPRDENDTIAINYTSGTTGHPKGVMYTHRGVYLESLCNLLEMNMSADSVYLWTLPIFHANGWCFAWGVTALGATHVCMRGVVPDLIISNILEHKVTHFCGAPIVMGMIVEGAQRAGVQRFAHEILACTAAAPPSQAVIESMLKLNVDIRHMYGLTETYGPITVCEVQPEWRGLPPEQLAERFSRQGAPYILAEDVQVLDPSCNPVPADARTMGEVCMRGNLVMKGYYRNPEATAEALRGGWFHSGDLGVMHPDGYIELKDRAKDIIISGGENISTMEVERTLYRHPGVQDVAVVSRPDDKWGEVPVAFVTAKPGAALTEGELIEFCRANLAHFKAPKNVFFEVLPRTSTGKVQKYVLRERLWQGKEKRIQG